MKNRLVIATLATTLLIWVGGSSGQAEVREAGKMSDGNCRCKATCDSGATPRGFAPGQSKAACKKECEQRFEGCKAGEVRKGLRSGVTPR